MVFYKNIKHQFLLLLLFFHWNFCAAQKSQSWEVYGGATQFNYTGINAHYGFGTMYDYFLTEKISIRGSLFVNSNYLRLSFAPIFWAYFHDELENPNNKKRTHHNTHHSHSSTLAATYLTYLIAPLLSDGIVYNMKLFNHFYFCPYFAPIQIHVYNSRDGQVLNDGTLTSSIGLGFKEYIKKHFVLYFGAEYSRTILFINSRSGFSLSASMGYVIKDKKRYTYKSNKR